MRKFILLLSPLLAACTHQRAEPDHAPQDYRADALAVPQMIAEQYAYLDRFEGNAVPFTPQLQVQAAAVSDVGDLLAFTENMLLALRDHHAITGSSFPDSWAVVPTYADLWIVRRDGRYLVDAVREGSPAQENGVVAGMELVGIGEATTSVAVGEFLDNLGLADREDETLGFAARVLAAGRRDSRRFLTFSTADETFAVNLPNLYQVVREDLPPVTLLRDGDVATIRINNSLGDEATIAAFDAAMAEALDARGVVLDLTETPSGGNTTVARAIMGWFVSQPSPYQVHSLPAEARRTGIVRQWTEYVLPREGRHFGGRVRVRVGRWTGSMGEGLAIGMQALGAGLEGHAMAGLRGAIYDLTTERTGLLFKLPVERLTTVEGMPREDVIVD